MTPGPKPPRAAPARFPLARFVLLAREQQQRARRVSRSATLAALLLALGGCASYSPRPLAAHADSATALAQLRVNVHDIPLPRLAAQPLDLDRPLPMPAVAALAVLNNPQLRLARDRLGIAQAQAFAAGLLPDPRLSASRAFAGNSAGATTTAFSYGLDFDLGALLTRPAARAAARAHVRSVDLDLLWQEWQTASQAQLLYVQLVGLARRQQLLGEEAALGTLRLRRLRAAALRGELPRTDADAQLARLQALRQSIADTRRSRVNLQGQLHTLLGLAPHVPLRLAGMPRLPANDAAQVRSALQRVALIRPDLLALQAGYRSQEQNLREAVLAQFPSISVGLTRARDNTDVNTIGFGVSFSLPLFNGARGRVAVQRATRRELFDAYQLRLDQTRADAEQALRNLGLLRREATSMQASLPDLRSAAHAAELALRRGEITLPQAQAQRQALLDQRLALQQVRQQQAEQAVALDLLTGTGLYRTQPAGAADHKTSGRD